MKNVFRAAVVAISVAVSLLGRIGSAEASQNSCILPNTGTVSGLTLVNDANACTASILSLYSGASAPSSPTAGMFWFNTSTNFIEQYDGTQFLNLWFVDATNHVQTDGIAGGITSVTVASAATTDIGAVPQPFKTITGTTTITSLGASSGIGSIHVIKFAASLTLTYNATSLIVPGALNITTQAGDIAFAMYQGGGNWSIISYQTASGAALLNPTFPLGTVLFGDYGTVPTKFVYGFGQALTRTSFAAYLAAVTRAQSGTLTSGNATITAIANTAGFGVGMPVEGSGGIGAGCTIASVVANTSITLNSGSCITASGSFTVTTFLTGYGNGGSGSTVGVKDCRGRGMAGRDDLGGTAAGRLVGQTADNNGLGTATATLVTSNLPPYTPSGSVASSSSAIVLNTGVFSVSAGGTTLNGPSGVTSSNQTPTITSTFTGTAAPGQISAPFGIVQPTVTSDCIVAVLP